MPTQSDFERQEEYETAMRTVMEEARTNAPTPSPEYLASLSDAQLTAFCNSAGWTDEQRQPEITRRKDVALRAKWRGRFPQLDQLNLSDASELFELRRFTPEKWQRELGRRNRCATENTLYWFSHRPDLQPPPRTHDEELMLADDRDLHLLRNEHLRAAKRGDFLVDAPFTVEEIELELESRRIAPGE